MGLLGPLVVERDGDPVRIAAATQRRALIHLAVHVGEVVSTDRLADAVWGDDPPHDAAHAVHSLVYRLRCAVGAGEALIQRVDPGYQLALARHAIDACVFADRTNGARKLASERAAEARSILVDALAMWRGDALVDVAYEPWAAAEIRRLTELRLTACEALALANITLGDGDLAIAELESLTERFPLRESLWALLWQALAATGRHLDVVASHRRASEVLADDFDLALSPHLDELARAYATAV